MKKIFVALIIFYSLTISLQAQVKQVYNLNSEFNYPVQISGMDIINDSLFILSENCKYLYQYKISKLKKDSENLPLQKIYLPFLENMDLEGLAIFEHYIFCVNEKDNTIKAIDIKNYTSVKVEKDIEELPKNDSKNILETGLEGIDINKDKSLLYVIQERDKFKASAKAKILAYRIDSQREKFILTYVDQLTINLSDDFRYTGITLSSDNKSIFLIRSKYINEKQGGRYFIDKINLESTGVFQLETASMTDFKLYEIDHNAIDDNNLEGIAHHGDKLYTINDNLEGQKNCFQTIKDPTHIYTLKDKK